ncbi:hypothetical protein LDL08_14680 [Nonomuraea glycinis]|uniref:Uncharacterized protein n=1 Tax=Nonomuraea glycinis TaxID=2047744 RepID=A0A918E5M3_9ACTN|nr:hypothetical protein [Nonomuraea glycinis]MCA2177433.1 hypothetical protein [Nonomuraea glycinis]GGP09292.1 hypothetical protein GCM10012278_44400 [Nonomuraea glycinis]
MRGIGGRYGRLVRSAGAVLGGVVVAGIVVGLAARLLMSAITIAAAEESQFTLAGTVAILFVFAVLAVPAAATATARPVVRRAGRWLTAGATGWATASTGFADGPAVLLAPEGRMPYIVVLIVAFGTVVVAHGNLAQLAMRRLAGPPPTAAPPLEAAQASG